jgi:hypothetical protein
MPTNPEKQFQPLINTDERRSELQKVFLIAFLIRVHPRSSAANNALPPYPSALDAENTIPAADKHR